ncbi:choline dehydrogenase [Pseudomonas laurylsulfativorans]|uniref:Choline dehydrogenase n=1 Tax=Pseudomonas laurylsulfativorans TaxID=1943631 RepID=A0A2S3VS11_9PSED|nr:choline dehydrogenase [Pseudomonas laurylsulfativorans]POF42429.1 choline dehydrogenase [Pseudomonas laurylsulfativorans]
MRDINGRNISNVYDYIVIGSGSAGSVIAGRLSEDQGRSVLMLEAGPSDKSIFIQMPAALGFPLMNDRFNWYIHSEPEKELDGRTIYEARGRVLGGSSSINGMNWVRGNPWDYDNWAAMGLKGWSYDECLPYFRKAETFDQGGNDYRGDSGPMHIQTCAANNPLYKAFIEAGVQAGYPYMQDHNAYRQEGVHITQRNVHKGIRWSTSQAYIHPNKHRENLHVCDKAQVTRIEFAGKRAVRVHFQRDGKPEVLSVNKEVILCAGAIHSPHLLMLSGIGNAEHLAEFGIKCVADLPGVGEGMKDHIAAPVQYRATQNVSIAKQLTPIGKFKLGAMWTLFKKGLGATNFFEVGAFIRTNDDIKVPNVQFEFIPMLGEFQHGSVKLENGFQYFFSLMRPTSTGRVWLGSADPLAAPKFNFNFLSTQEDRDDAVAAVKAIRHVVSQPAWDPYRGEEVTPGPSVQTDEEILQALRGLAGTNYHPSCTCRMGTDEMSVVDARARVHGIENLRVVDASIMPEIVSGNLNAPVIMMAEKIADDIRGVAPLTKAKAKYYSPA